jgi:hypothetical protein
MVMRLMMVIVLAFSFLSWDIRRNDARNAVSLQRLLYAYLP